jgi:hypothetical protein
VTEQTPTPTPPEVGRWTGMGEALGRFALQTLGAIVVVGIVGALVAVGTGHDIAGGMAGAYYLVGAALFLIGMFPTGGFSMIRGTLTRRKPTGARQEAHFLMGLLLIAVGVLFDLTRPF